MEKYGIVSRAAKAFSKLKNNSSTEWLFDPIKRSQHLAPCYELLSFELHMKNLCDSMSQCLGTTG